MKQLKLCKYFVKLDCTVGFYGDDCDKICGQCMDGTSCNVSSGVCPSGCRNNWEGPMCTGNVIMKQK